MSKKTTKMKTKSRNNSWIWVLVGLVVIVAGVLILNYGNSQGANALPNTLTPQKASERFSQGAFLLDVREQSEWDEVHVEGAVLIPLSELPARISELPQDQDILIICRSGNRSAQARDFLRETGFERTTSISGGINAWVSAGLPVVKDN